jgi:hypothetical protein
LKSRFVNELKLGHEAATVSVQGTDGAMLVTLGLRLNYPTGKPETIDIATRATSWTQAPTEGRWFPDAFVGRMANLQLALITEGRSLRG